MEGFWHPVHQVWITDAFYHLQWCKAAKPDPHNQSKCASSSLIYWKKMGIWARPYWIRYYVMVRDDFEPMQKIGASLGFASISLEPSFIAGPQLQICTPLHLWGDYWAFQLGALYSIKDGGDAILWIPLGTRISPMQSSFQIHVPRGYWNMNKRRCIQGIIHVTLESETSQAISTRARRWPQKRPGMLHEYYLNEVTKSTSQILHIITAGLWTRTIMVQRGDLVSWTVQKKELFLAQKAGVALSSESCHPKLWGGHEDMPWSCKDLQHQTSCWGQRHASLARDASETRPGSGSDCVPLQRCREAN